MFRRYARQPLQQRLVVRVLQIVLNLTHAFGVVIALGRQQFFDAMLAARVCPLGADEVRIVITDDALVQDPETIIERFAPEFEKLVLWALMSAEY